jgi:trypsin-like peptidase/ZZ type zinc finger protein
MSSSDLIHVWSRCHGCGAAPIVGLRFACQTCPSGADNDLCEPCYRLFEQGRLQHPSPHAREAPAGQHTFRSFQGAERERALPWLAVPFSPALAPSVPDRSVVRPEFRTGPESFFGSYGFVIAEEGRIVLLTALHVLDELAMFSGIDCSEDNLTYTGLELPQRVSSVKLYDPFAPNWVLAELGMAGHMLTLPNARVPAVEPYSQRDIAAFRVVSSGSFQPLRLATKPPALGESIWLAVNPGRGALERTRQAVVVESTNDTLVFRFEKTASIPLNASGAPLLNRAAEVVGINVGRGTLDGHKIGHGNHVTSIRQHLGW